MQVRTEEKSIAATKRRSSFRYSHGFVVSVDDLLEYIEPNYESLAVGQNVICKQGTDGLWKPGVTESVEKDNHVCVVRFTHFNALEAIPFESIVTTSRSK